MFSKNIPRDTSIKVAFFDNDGKKVGGLTVEEANRVWQLDNSKLFYFQTGDGTEQELTIQQVNQLTPEKDLLPTAPACPTDPQSCGPPLVKFFGGNGGFGAAANAVISPISSSVIGFDIVNAGKGFLSQVNAELIDTCGKGSGSSLTVNMEPDTTGGTGTGAGGAGGTGTGAGGAGGAGTGAGGAGGAGTGAGGAGTGAGGAGGTGTGAGGAGSGSEIPLKIKNITINAPGDGYLSAPDGSLGGNERVWKEPDEGYVRTPSGGYYVVQPLRPIEIKSGSTYYPPDGPPRVLTQDEIITLPIVPVKPSYGSPQSPGQTIGPSQPIGTPQFGTQPGGGASGTPPFGTPYPVVLCIEEIKVLDPGFGYRPGDELIISPDNGTKTQLVINEFGNITGVKIIQGGCGYDDFPEIRTNSPTGFNATFTPIFKVTQIDPTKPIESQVTPVKSSGSVEQINFAFDAEEVRLVTVIDCVGKIPQTSTFNVPR